MQFKKLKKLPVADSELRCHLEKWLATTFSEPHMQIEFDEMMNVAYRSIIKKGVGEGSVAAFLDIVANVYMKARKCDVYDALCYFMETRVFDEHPTQFTELLDYLYADDQRFPSSDSHDYEFMVVGFTRAYLNTKPDTQYAAWVPHFTEDKKLVGYS